MAELFCSSAVAERICSGSAMNRSFVAGLCRIELIGSMIGVRPVRDAYMFGI